MSDKSNVSLEQRTCLVCGKPYATGTVLLDRRLQPRLDQHTMTGWGLCPEHEKLNQDGFIALIECDPERSDLPDTQGTLKPWQVFRTGVVTFLKREAFLQLFDVPSHELVKPCMFVEPAVTQLLRSRAKDAVH